MSIRSIFLLTTWLFTSLAYSQKNIVVGNTFSSDAVVIRPRIQLQDATDESEVVRRIGTLLASDKSSWQVVQRQSSPGGRHYTVVQFFAGKKIYDSDVRVNVSNSGKIISVVSNAKNTDGWDEKVLGKTMELPDYVTDLLKVRFQDYNMIASQQVIAFSTEIAVQPALLIALKDDNQRQVEVLLGKERMLFVRDCNSYFAGDSLVNGMVFNPDPLTTAHVTYGGSYRDFSDSDVTLLNAQRQFHSFRTHYANDTFRLRNDYIQLMDLNNDNIIPVVSLIPQFYFTRSQKGFEDVNAFYHLSQQQQHIHQLGFNCADQVVLADPHGLGTCQGSCDNSYFSPPQNLLFGQGGVDDAEDADVLIHEYTHFVSYNASPGSNSGMSRSAVDEGCGDYFAASYSKALDPYHWGDVYNWDGHNEFWDGRSVVQPWRIPQDSNNSIYHNGQIWSAGLMHLHDIIGRPACDSLVLQFLYGLAPNMSFESMAQQLIDADTLLTGGSYFCPIYQSFFPRGMLPYVTNSCGVFPNGVANIATNALVFLPKEHSFSFRFLQEEVPLQLYIYDMNGKKVAETTALFFNGEALASGVYVVRAESHTFTATYKWIKYQ